jgi:hypothetical protein
MSDESRLHDIIDNQAANAARSAVVMWAVGVPIVAEVVKRGAEDLFMHKDFLRFPDIADPIVIVVVALAGFFYSKSRGGPADQAYYRDSW